MVRPMSMFCCGCSLTFGVVLVIIFNILQNMFYIVSAVSNIILKIPTFGVHGGLTMQTFNGAWCMLGLPFIIVGILGVMYRLENHVQLYFWYLLVSVLMDLGFLIFNLVSKDVCDDMPFLLEQHGSAFACGTMRILSLFVVVLVVVMESYFVFTVYSLVEDLKAGGSGAGLPELLRGAHEAHKAKHFHTHYGDSLFGQPVAPGYPRHYGTTPHPGLHSSQGIGPGDYHETAYPPPSSF
mmetsp:Transcript_105645/g.340714  ORF Transcript_105645/g.340714 Transcript_105645/m.340714 type:complete len:238 (+) Transcript_105645:118-831(+)